MPKFWSTFTVSFEWWESVSSSYAQTGFAIQYFAWCAICAWYIFLNPQCERTCFHCADIHIMLHWLERAVQYVINFHTIKNLRARHSCRCFLEKYDLGKNVKIIFFDNWCPVWHSVVCIVVMPTNSIFVITTFNSCCLEFERKTCHFTAPCLGKFPRRGIWLQEKHWTVAVTLSPCFPYLLSLLKAEHKIHLECKMIFCALRWRLRHCDRHFHPHPGHPHLHFHRHHASHTHWHCLLILMFLHLSYYLLQSVSSLSLSSSCSCSTSSRQP